MCCLPFELKSYSVNSVHMTALALVFRVSFHSLFMLLFIFNINIKKRVQKEITFNANHKWRWKLEQKIGAYFGKCFETVSIRILCGCKKSNGQTLMEIEERLVFGNKMLSDVLIATIDSDSYPLKIYANNLFNVFAQIYFFSLVSNDRASSEWKYIFRFDDDGAGYFVVENAICHQWQ